MVTKPKTEPLRPGDIVPIAGGRQAELVREDSGEHVGNVHFRTVDSLSLMLKNGTITPQMHDAGQDFSATFLLAQLNGPSVPALDRIPGGQWRDSMTERVAYAVSRRGTPAGGRHW